MKAMRTVKNRDDLIIISRAELESMLKTRYDEGFAAATRASKSAKPATGQATAKAAKRNVKTPDGEAKQYRAGVVTDDGKE